MKEYLIGIQEWTFKVMAKVVEVEEGKLEYLNRLNKERAEELAGKKLHSKFFLDVVEKAGERS